MLKQKADEYQWRTGRSCIFKSFYHLVFVSKYRREVFSKEMLERLKQLFQVTCEQMEAEPHKEYWSQLKRKLWGKHLWSPSYCVVSCGGAPLSIVKKYIEQQRTPPSEKAVTVTTSIRQSARRK